MKKLYLVLLASLLLTACDDGQVKGASVATVQDAHEVLLKGKQAAPFLFLDVRTPGEYANGHVPGAKNIPLQTLAERLAEVPKDGKVFVYCESGARSTRATKMLVDAGFKNIINMKASMRGWRNAGFEIER
jgi:rhodanese-related sulfurtransferase